MVLTVPFLPVALLFNFLNAYSNSLLELKGNVALELLLTWYVLGLLIFLFSSDLYVFV